MNTTVASSPIEKESIKIAQMIRDVGINNILLVKHEDTEIPEALKPFTDSLEVKNSKFMEKDKLYLVDKRIGEMQFPLNPYSK